MNLDQIEALFHQAMELPPAGRIPFAERQCAQDPQALRELLDLLRADADSGDFLEGSLVAELAAAAAPARAGRWKIEERLGEGGLGVVYRAVAEDGDVRLVGAIKFLRPGFDAGSFRERFRKERRILASLDHPYIARVLDAGVDDGGRLYLVMEYISGRPLHQVADDDPLTRPQRLELAKRICEAVQYLHTHLIAHGDIKPSNVLIAAENVPKLVDFGAARFRTPDPSGDSEVTLAVATPRYASPEQSRGDSPSVAGDIYSLGVLLGDVFVDDSDPDLRAIREKATRDEPGDRYRTVLELQQDLERFRTGRPVLAREGRFRYRFGKFLRRNAVAVGLSAALAVSVIAGAAVSWRKSRQSAEHASHMRRVVRSLLESGPANLPAEASDRTALRRSLESAIVYLNAGGDPRPRLELAAAHRQLALLALEQRKVDREAIGHAEASFREAAAEWAARRQPEAQRSQALTLLIWNALLWVQGEEWLDKGLEAISLLREMGWPQGLESGGRTYTGMLLRVAGELRRRDRQEEAQSLLLEALPVARRDDTKEIQASVLLDIAAIDFARGREEQGRQRCRLAAEANPTAARLYFLCGVTRAPDPSSRLEWHR
ncbi:MAG: serine/threonine protein kinase, partial [Bryobacteraceae bacterium]